MKKIEILFYKTNKSNNKAKQPKAKENAKPEPQPNAKQDGNLYDSQTYLRGYGM